MQIVIYVLVLITLSFHHANGQDLLPISDPSIEAEVGSEMNPEVQLDPDDPAVPTAVPQDPVADLGADEVNWDSQLELEKNNQEFDQVTIRDIVEPKVDYRYAAFDVPDPFVPPLIDSAGRTKETDVVNTLSQYKVSNLNVVGIWETSPGIRKAFVKTADGARGVTVEVGDPIGSEGGEVVNIEKNHIRIREFRLTEDGTRQFRDTIRVLGANKESESPGQTDEIPDPNSGFENQSESQPSQSQGGLIAPPVPQSIIQGAPSIESPAPTQPQEKQETQNSGGIISI